MCTSSVSSVICHKFSHGAAFYTLNGKNVNVVLEFKLIDVARKLKGISTYEISRYFVSVSVQISRYFKSVSVKLDLSLRNSLAYVIIPCSHTPYGNSLRAVIVCMSYEYTYIK